jgi:hypothetical protein
MAIIKGEFIKTVLGGGHMLAADVTEEAIERQETRKQPGDSPGDSISARAAADHKSARLPGKTAIRLRAPKKNRENHLYPKSLRLYHI